MIYSRKTTGNILAIELIITTLSMLSVSID